MIDSINSEDYKKFSKELTEIDEKYVKIIEGKIVKPSHYYEIQLTPTFEICFLDGIEQKITEDIISVWDKYQ